MDILGIIEELDHNLLTLISITGSVGTLAFFIKKWLRAEIDKVDMQQTKNFLTRALADVERGVYMQEVEMLRIKETYDWYIAHEGNTYIKDKYKELERKNMI